MYINSVTSASGAVTELLSMHNARTDTYRRLLNAGTLSKLDFEEILAGIKALQKRKLNGMQDLMDRGLTINTPIGKTVVTKESHSDMGEAQVDINPTQFDDNDSEITQESTPNPIIHHTFSVPFRQEGFSYKQDIGQSLGMRRIMEKSEDILFNGETSIKININGAIQSIFGYTTHPNAATATITDWNAASTSILSDVRKVMEEMFTTNAITAEAGSVMLYVDNSVWKEPLAGDAFSAKGDRSFKEQILAQNPEIADVKPAENLAANKVVAVYMQPETIQLSVSQTPTVIPWTKTMDLERSKWTSYASWVPLIHSDFNSKTGIVVGST